MACYRPLKAYRTPPGSDKAMTFNATKALNADHVMKLPCGKCIGCRNDEAQSWAVRCYHENQMHQASSFITLTYANEHLPADYSVNVEHAQRFIRALRKKLLGKIRFFLASEYGDLDFRPHYHALIFGWDFHTDRKVFKQTKDGPLYTSELLTSTWGKGHCTLGNVTYKSALYTASYVFEKRYGEQAPSRYLRHHPITEAVVNCQPEFRLMSSQPGLGSTWFDKYKNDAFPSDFLVIDGRHLAVPRYYLNKLEQQSIPVTRQLPAYDLTINSTEHREVTRARKRNSTDKSNTTTDRLKVRETIHQARLDRRKHSL
jgi:hypothetical protein